MKKFHADPAALYFTDNGCVLCGEHLGSSALHTGRDISGQPIQRVTLADVRESRLIAPDCPDLRCEQCDKELVGTTGPAEVPYDPTQDTDLTAAQLAELHRLTTRGTVRRELARRLAEVDGENNMGQWLLMNDEQLAYAARQAGVA